MCTVEGCEKRHYGRGLCKMHWARWWKAEGRAEEPLSVEVLIDFLAGRLTRADLAREILKRCPQEVVR